MADRLVRISSSPRAVPFPHRNRAGATMPMLLRGVIFVSVLSAPFIAALLAG
jgi:hypothetical protein